MKIALAQLNPTVGDIAGNVRRILDAYRRAADEGADLVLTPELSILGYPPKDLLLKPRFVEDSLAALDRLVREVGRPGLVVGYAAPREGKRGRPLHNAVALLADGRVQGTVHKRLLPFYDVFDEARYFEPGDEAVAVEYDGLRIGMMICEDMWADEEAGPTAMYHHANPATDLAVAGVHVLLVPSASPFGIGKLLRRREVAEATARRHEQSLLYVNQVGGNDDLVFDGASFAVAADGRLIAQLAGFEEDLRVVEVPARADAPEVEPAEVLPGEDEFLRRALVLGLRDYMRKVGFTDCVIGLSGGVDSSLVACLAAEAVGPERVHGVAMPSRHSSRESIEDAEALAGRLGISLRTIPIEGPHAAFEKALADAFADTEPDVAEENIQARVRGTLLMALSNKFGYLVLATGNKSELSVGYCTLYGDMVGGLAVIGDVPKTLVYRLCRRINETDPRRPVPERVLTKAPSAELKPGQTDQDALPPYDVLDGILNMYVHDEASQEEIVEAGFDADTVARVVRMVDGAEYKRQQAAPVLKVTGRAFGFGRRMPIAQRYEPDSI